MPPNRTSASESAPAHPLNPRPATPKQTQQKKVLHPGEPQVRQLSHLLSAPALSSRGSPAKKWRLVMPPPWAAGTTVRRRCVSRFHTVMAPAAPPATSRGSPVPAHMEMSSFSLETSKRLLLNGSAGPRSCQNDDPLSRFQTGMAPEPPAAVSKGSPVPAHAGLMSHILLLSLAPILVKMMI